MQEQSDRIERLESLVASIVERVEALEHRLAERTAPAQPPPEAESHRPTREELASKLRDIQCEAPSTTPYRRPLKQTPAPTEETPPTAAAAPRPPAVSDRPAAAARARGGVSDMERTLGARVFAVAGALVIIAAAALFMKLAWDRGWLEMAPPQYRVSGAALFGFALLGVGEWARRRINAIASAGLSAAGIGVVYASAYAAYGVFHLIGPAGGFAAPVGTSALGVAIAARANLASVGVVSLAGAYLAPLLLGETESHPATLPVYWIALLTTGLILSAWRAGWFTALRTLVWWATVLFGGVWTLTLGQDSPLIALGFLAAAWALVQGELLHAARAGRLLDTPLRHKASAARHPLRAARPLGSSMSITVWAALLAGVTLDRAWGLDWAAPGAGFVVTALLAIPLMGHLRALRDKPETDLERIGVLFAAQSGALLIATIALAMAGWLETAAWLALAIAAMGAGRWIRVRGLDAYGLIVLILATWSLLPSQWWSQAALGGATYFGIVPTQGGALVALTGVAWILAGVVIRRSERGFWSAAPYAAAPGLLLLCMSVQHQDASASSQSVVYLALSLLAYHARRIVPAMALDILCVIPLAMSVLTWLAAYDPTAWIDAAYAAGGHPGLWLALGIGAAGAGYGWGLLRRHTEMSDGLDARTIGVMYLVCAGALAFAATSLEVARAAGMLLNDPTSQRAAVSIWWGLLGVGLIGGGFWRRLSPVRHTGLGLLSLATAKAVFFDLASVSQEWRVVSFLTLGLLLLGVGVLYARLSARAADPTHAQ